MQTYLLLLSVLNLLLSAGIAVFLFFYGKDTVPSAQKKPIISNINRPFGLNYAKVLKKDTPIDEFLKSDAK